MVMMVVVLNAEVRSRTPFPHKPGNTSTCQEVSHSPSLIYLPIPGRKFLVSSRYTFLQFT
ncbi:hypothetical protein E2C01_037075 [Portunus trituberculatus]|uniref:Uncharacterized protein n=1 Tax=Portunus trituberculatus TaxID=210409 RepID=A0A5B7FEE3_PORTR|nr:hypothetical protein [Portunus trituberculatus]